MKLSLLVLSAGLVLSGCIPAGRDSFDPVVIGRRAATATTGEETVLRTDNRLLAYEAVYFDGRHQAVPNVVHANFSLVEGRGAKRELPFLSAKEPIMNGSSGIQSALPVPDSNLWVGIQPPDAYRAEAQARKEKRQLGPSQRDLMGELHLVVFSPEKILREITTSAPAVDIRERLVEGGRELQFWRKDGWWLIDLTTGTERKLPGRIEESLPDVDGFLLPGTRYRIGFRVPMMTVIREGIGSLSYELKAAVAIDGVSTEPVRMVVHAGSSPIGAGATREQVISSDLGKTSRQRLHTDRFDELIWREERGSSGQPATQTFAYYLDCEGTPVRILIELPAPYERWQSMLKQFEEYLRMDKI